MINFNAIQKVIYLAHCLFVVIKLHFLQTHKNLYFRQRRICFCFLLLYCCSQYFYYIIYSNSFFICSGNYKHSIFLQIDINVKLLRISISLNNNIKYLLWYVGIFHLPNSFCIYLKDKLYYETDTN